MTLIVARRLKRTVRVCSDSRLTDRNQIERGYLAGALKAVILDRNTCVALSGEANFASAAVRKLGQAPKMMESSSGQERIARRLP